MKLPSIIQGGMGIGVSNWRLANAVSAMGELGVVSGTAANSVLVRRLQLGDLDGLMRKAMSHFPFKEYIQPILEKYFVEGGIRDATFKRATMSFQNSTAELLRLSTVATFVEVFLAKLGHKGQVGINFLEKTQLANLPGLYGAMLAGVDYVLMGAGIPREIPGILDRFAKHENASMRLNVEGAGADEDFRVGFAPMRIFEATRHDDLKRPLFLPIISSVTLAQHLIKKSTGTVDGFVVEGHIAGGHNAPPRGGPNLSPSGEPVYGTKDAVNLEKIRELGLPFWLAGGYGHPEKVIEAWAHGAAGVQVGSAFALCEESGLTPEIKKQVVEVVLSASSDKSRVFTDPKASPSGYPFKVMMLEGTLSDDALYRARSRKCDLGYLRQPYKKENGTLGYRCPAEEVDAYTKKQGNEADTVGRKCLCNGLLANVGLAQRQEDGTVEKPLVTLGDDVLEMKELLREVDGKLTVGDVVRYLKNGMRAQTLH